MHTRFGSSLLGVAGCLACAAGDDAPSSGTEGTSSGATTSMIASTAVLTSSSGDASTTESSDATSSDVTSTTDDTTTTVTTNESTTNEITSTTAERSESSSTGNGDSACMAGCQVEVDCGFCATKWRSVEACVEWCTANLDEAAAFADDCRDAWAGMHACVGVLSCEDFTDWCLKDPPAAYPCEGADQELSFECKGQ